MSSSAAAAKLRSSCDACLANKTKCSRAKPSCARCTQRGKPCIYSQCRKIGRPSRHDRAASSSCHAQDAPIQPKRLLPPSQANDTNHNAILPLPNNISGGQGPGSSQGDAAAAHRDADSLASFLSKSHAMLDNVLLASTSASASACPSDGGAVDDMADVNIDSVHPDDESAVALDSAMQWENMDQFLSTGLGSCCLAGHSEHEQQEYDDDTAGTDADADLVDMSYAISTPILGTSSSSFSPVSVSPDAIFSTTGSASGHYSLSPDFPPTTITATTTPENGPLASHPKRHLLYSHQHHHHPLTHLHDPGPASASASLTPPTPIYHAHAGREAGVRRPRPHAERNSIIAGTANVPPTRPTGRRESRSSSTTSTSTTTSSSLPSSRARCRRDCHVKLVRQLDYITESRVQAHSHSGRADAEAEAGGLPLDALLAMDGRVRQEHDKILGCDACMSSSRVNQTLMMVTTALSSMLDLFKKGSRSKSTSRSRSNASSPASTSSSSSSSSSKSRSCPSSPLTVGQLLVDDDAKYSCSRQLLRMFLERQIRTISALNELTIHVGQQNNATLKVTRDLLCDITKRVHYFLGLLEMTESSISANTRRRIRST